MDAYLTDDLDYQDQNGNKIIHIAARNNQVDILLEQLNKGADVDQTNTLCQTPLMLAAYNGHLQSVQVIINHNASIWEIDELERTALILAIRQNHLQVSQVLLDAEHQQKQEQPRRLEKYATALTYYAAKGMIKPIEQLVYLGASLEECGCYGETCLISAAKHGQFNVCRFLLSMGAKLEVKDNFGNNALMVSARKNSIKVVRLLIEAGCKINEVSKKQQSAIVQAVYMGNSEVVKLLLQQDAVISYECDQGHNLQQIAELNGFAQVCEILLDYSKDYTVYANPAIVAQRFFKKRKLPMSTTYDLRDNYQTYCMKEVFFLYFRNDMRLFEFVVRRLPQYNVQFKAHMVQYVHKRIQAIELEESRQERSRQKEQKKQQGQQQQLQKISMQSQLLGLPCVANGVGLQNNSQSSLDEHQQQIEGISVYDEKGSIDCSDTYSRFQNEVEVT